MRIGFVNRLQFIRKAFSATKHEMLISLGIVLALTVILSIIFYIVESIAQPDVYRDYWDALVWAYTRYMEGGDGVFEGGPVTVAGKAIASLLGLIGIALVAIPAGLVGSGFMDAIAEEKREEELAHMHQRMLKQYPRFVSAALNEYLRALPGGMPEQYKNVRITTRGQLISRFQTRLGMDFKDIADVCNTYPELRIRDMADEISDEQNPVSNFVVELLPVNTPYGCFVNRGSNVTIMVTNGFEEMGTSWFGYHIALFGGFNFICKNQEADPDERDSYYVLSNAATEEQQQMRSLFMKDLQSVSGKGKWVINIQSAVRSSRNKLDFHFIYDNRDRNNPSVEQVAEVEKLIAAVNEAFSKAPFDDEPHIAEQSERYPLIKNNIAYKLREASEGTNIFHIRVASNLINMDLRRSVVMYILADRIRQAFAPQQPLREEDIQELRSKGYGYNLKA